MTTKYKPLTGWLAKAICSIGPITFVIPMLVFFNVPCRYLDTLCKKSFLWVFLLKNQIKEFTFIYLYIINQIYLKIFLVPYLSASKFPDKLKVFSSEENRERRSLSLDDFSCFPNKLERIFNLWPTQFWNRNRQEGEMVAPRQLSIWLHHFLDRLVASKHPSV